MYSHHLWEYIFPPPIERFHIHGNENNKNITRNLPVIMPYLRHIVEPTYRALYWSLTRFFKGEGAHHICYFFLCIISIFHVYNAKVR